MGMLASDMAEQNSQDRNLPASQRKIRKSREQGQLPRSRDLTHFAVLAAAGVLLSVGAPMAMDWSQRLVIEGLHFDAAMLVHPSIMTERLSELSVRALMFVLPVASLLALVAVAANIAIGGWNMTFAPLRPKFSHLNPLPGLGRLFYGQGLGQALKAVLLAIVMAVIAGMVLRNRVAGFIGLMTVPLPNAIAYAGQQIMSGLSLLGIALAIFAVVDAPLQRQLYLRRLKMSREEVKQEMKEVEGNTQIKAKIRARMREMAKRRMLAAVPLADLVVMNPTHYAVALKYEEGRMTAPKVVAKGADLLAMRIRDLAKDAKVPVLQSPMLARALYAHAELDKEIPAALFAAVAQVLAYVYQLRAALAGRGVAPAQVPNPEVPPELDPHNKPFKPQDALDDEPEDEA